MPHSLRVRLRNLKHKGELSEADVDRIIFALNFVDGICDHPDKCHECDKILTCTYWKEKREKND